MICRGTLWLNKGYYLNVKECYLFEKYNVSARSQSPNIEVDISMVYESMRDNKTISIYVIEI